MNSHDQEQTASEPWTPEFTGVESPVHCLDCDRPLGFAMVAGFKIACCEECHGMLFQRDTLGPSVNRCRSAWRKLDCKVVPLDRQELEKRTLCPACGELMETHPYVGPGCVAIDSCSSCELVWFSGGELDRVIQSPGKRQYSQADLDRAEVSFIKPAAPAVPSGNNETDKPTQLQDDVFRTLLDLIDVLGI